MLDFCFKDNIVADIELVMADEVNKSFRGSGERGCNIPFVIDMVTLKN